MASADDVAKSVDEVESILGGVWVLIKNENLDDYLKEIGVNFVLRKLAAAASSTMTITREGTFIRIVTKGPKDTDHRFELNKEVQSVDPNDNPMRATVTWADGTLTTDSHPLEGSNGKATLVTRKIVGGQLIMTVKVNNITLTRIFKKKE